MPGRRRKKQRKSETRGEFLKRVRADYAEHLKGRVIKEHPGFNRRDKREMFIKSSSPRFSPGERTHRTEGANDLGPGSGLAHESPLTKQPLGRRRARRRAANHVAREARRRNRA